MKKNLIITPLLLTATMITASLAFGQNATEIIKKPMRSGTAKNRARAR